MRPTITVIMYIPSCRATTSKSLIAMIFPQIRQAIPRGEYLKNRREKKKKTPKKSLWDSELKSGPSYVTASCRKPFAFISVQSFDERGPWGSVDAAFYFSLTALSEICFMDMLSPALMKDPKANLVVRMFFRNSGDKLYHLLVSTKLKVGYILLILFDLPFHSSFLENWEEILSFSEGSLEFHQAINWYL